MAALNDKTLFQLAARPACQRQQGFTLLEVLVAMVLLGAGLAIAFTAISGSTRLEAKSTAHAAALALAQAKLDEVLSHPDYLLAADAGEERFAGIDLGYRIQVRPVPLLEPAQQALLTEFKSVLHSVEIEVFWGPKAAPQAYRLATYRLDPPPAAATAKPAAAAAAR
ncbi:type II secretion system protein [Giesbergeria sp.]|uniref:type II secretion system protein n=1 Tax=Giesbergeria sp. TaxID=2818473 RepID=UPI0026291652|nr:type II secretion system protein [Giesbergeria sp.]